MSLKDKIKTKALEKNVKKLAANKYKLLNAAINDDETYEILIDNIIRINSGRKRARKYTYEVKK